MSVFRFKHFEVSNERSAMKVNTDGVLLGAVTEVFPGDRNILDIGTGTGTVALMLAQRLDEVAGEYHIHGIDIDTPSAEEAALNFRSSPWAAHMEAFNASLGSFSQGGEYDLIVSNPPYFDNSLQAPSLRRNAARHIGGGDADGNGETLSYREILEYSESHLSEDGRVSMVLPADQEKALLRYARMCGFLPWKLLRIKTVPRKAPSRIIVRFKKRAQVVECTEDLLTLVNEKGERTSQQASLLTDYIL